MPIRPNASQPFEILVDVKRVEIGLELAARHLAAPRCQEGVRLAQQRQVQIDPALDAVQRIVGDRVELDTRRLLRGKIGKAGHRQAGQRHGCKSDYGKILFQTSIRLSVMDHLSTLGRVNTTQNSGSLPTHRLVAFAG